MTLRKSDAAILLALLLSTIVVFLLLRSLGLGPRDFGAAAQATSTPATAAARPFETAIEQLMGEHRALEAAQLAASGEARLKGRYLECARETSVERMDVDQAMHCQAVADALMHRYFDGSLDRLLAWWREQSLEANGATAAGRT